MEMQDDKVDIPDSTMMPAENSKLTANIVHAGGDNGEALSEKDMTTHDHYMKDVNEILAELDEKREGDKRVVEEFRLKMNEMVDEICGQIEQRLVARYEKTNEKVSIKLEYLNEILGRVGVLEQELSDFNSAVGVLFQEASN
uniref:uncharacterized protein LOC120328052 n=1 Tax=Styela clava TaxID=7725 RepID=UPI00193AA815|nr:uncharacterized protein LOC120328052 [Styela clava]